MNQKCVICEVQNERSRFLRILSQYNYFLRSCQSNIAFKIINLYRTFSQIT